MWYSVVSPAVFAANDLGIVFRLHFIFSSLNLSCLDDVLVEYEATESSLRLFPIVLDSLSVLSRTFKNLLTLSYFVLPF